MGGDFVGRLRELERLQNLLSEASAGRAVTAFLSGEAGVGKSRLLGEFADRARQGGAYVLSGSCIELGGGGIPYAPLIDSLRLLVREHGEQRVRQLAGPAWSALAGLVSDFTGSAGDSRAGGGPGDRLRVFGAVLRLLDHIGRSAPVVLVFEDMHWADQSTLDLVAYLTRAKSSERALLLCSHRKDLHPGHLLRVLLAEPDFGRRVVRVELPRFGEADLRKFLVTLGPVDPDVVRRGYELSDGNAFFAEQLMVSGALTGSAAGRIPESISELMRARIRTLSKEGERVMRVAATAARRVDDRLLSAACRLDEDALDEALHECLEEGLLIDGPLDDTYVVRHALLREAIYEDMLPRERRRLHTEMAEAIAADSALSLADEMGAAVELAHHWHCARRDPEALTAAVRAGAVTIRKRAFHEAETQYKRALELWTRVPEEARPGDITREEVLVAAADAARWSGHAESAVGYVKEALVKVDEAADPGRAGVLYERLGSYQWEAAARAEAREAYLEADRLLSSSGASDAVYARVVAGLALADVHAGSYSTGLQQARRAAELADAAGAVSAKGRALGTAGIALTMLEQPQEGESLLQQALEIARQGDNLEDLFRAYGNLGVALEHTGDLARAVDIAREGLEYARRLGLAGARQGGVFANNAGVALRLSGRWDEAESLLNEVLLDQPPVVQSAYLRLTLAEIATGRGRFDEADRLIGEVRDQRITDPRFVAALYACEAEIAGWQGQSVRARDAVDHGLALVGDTENTLERLRLCAVGLRAAADEAATDRSAELYASAREAVGDGSALREAQVVVRLCEQERARAGAADTAAGWEAVAAAWDGLGRPYPAAYARWRQAAASLNARDGQGAASTARAARDTAAKLGAKPLRAEVAKLVDRIPTAVFDSLDARTGEGPDTAADRRGLTPREEEVFRLLVTEGLGNHDIGKRLSLADGTIATHLNRIMAKLGVKSRAEAVAYAYRTHYFGDSAGSAPTNG